MLTAILVDDDYPVVRYLSETVAWKELGIELVGCYSNGLEAWEGAQRSLPDIVITDIGMPKMNGLEMLEKLGAVHPLFRAVILSCHNEFHYAQQAMKLRVSDYILKESLDVGQLQRILRHISTDLCKEKDKIAEMLMYQRKQSINQSALKEQFLKDTLYQPSWTKDNWIEQARLNGISLEAKHYVPMVVSVDRAAEAARLRNMNDYTIVFAVENILQEIMDSMHRCVIFRYSNRDLVVLLCCDDPAREVQLAYYSTQKCIAAFQNYLKISVSCLIGQEARTPDDIRRTLAPMLNEAWHRFYLEEAKVHRFEKQKYSAEDIYGEYSRFFSVINDAIALNRTDELQSIVGGWAEWVKSEKFHPGDVKEWVLQLLLDLQMKTKVTLQYQPSLSEEKLHDAVNGIRSIDHLREWLLQYVCDLSRKLSMLAVRSKRTEVIKAQQYVIAHVTEKITLEDMAAHLNLNSSYFSRLFKRETNQNFIEYVNMVKLQKAKELLELSNKTVEEISDYLGYANKSYFIKLFKREVGMTPSEYTAWH
ncbi:helix-turn-helix domain-containing protein [Paenibacillus sp. MSJ-34]|nr:helix-turn-helix domain-containing protein [Paenibacillus sp. MSJ-34]MBU5440774.1 AraC family transcriptional regulator [Paenibacillus sp. MSJ-34]CAH0120370.1 Protein-glutamate methylesterase/protein-glutamine glutaminase [Paenibacillus sp. CECT 9249]